MTDKQIIIDGKECRYWFRLNPDDYRKCSLRGKDDNCDEIKDCFIKELLGKLANKEQECEELKTTLAEIKEIAEKIDDSDGCAYGDYDCDNCSSLEQETVCTYKVKKLILQKISEVQDV